MILGLSPSHRRASRQIGGTAGFNRATWAFVGLGVLLRVARYPMDYPLWWDEAFVAVNFIRRDYVDLLRPLDYGQVCPILFLWCELTLVKLLGFSEWSLRLFPLVLRRHQRRAVPSCGRSSRARGSVAAGGGDLRDLVPPDPSRRRCQAVCLGPASRTGTARRSLSSGYVRPNEPVGCGSWRPIAPVAIALSHPAIFVAAGSFWGFRRRS